MKRLSFLVWAAIAVVSLLTAVVILGRSGLADDRAWGTHLALSFAAATVAGYKRKESLG